MHDTVAVIYEFPHWALIFPLVGLGAYLWLSGRSPGAACDRLAYLTGRLSLFLICFYIPLVFYTGTWRHYNVPKSLSTQFLVCLMLASWWAVKGRLRRPLSPLLLPVACFFFVMVMTTFGAVNMAESWETLLLYGAVLIHVILLGVYLRRTCDIRLFCVIINISTVVVVLYALAQWFDWAPIWRAIEGPHETVFTRKPVSTMGNENYTAEFLNITFPLAVSLLIYSWGHPFWMVMYALVVCLSTIALLYIDCNATYMGFAVGFPVMALILIWYRAIPWVHSVGFLTRSSGEPGSLQDLRRWFRRVVFALVLCVSTFAAFTASVENPLRRRMTTLITWADMDGDHMPDGAPPMIFRLECMTSAGSTIYDNLVTGLGPGNFKVIHPRYESQLERKVLGEETLARKVHNDFLYHAVEYGCFGMLGFIWMWVTAFWCAFRALRWLDWTDREDAVVGPSTRPFSLDDRRFLFFFLVGAIGGMLIALVSCNFGHTFVIPASLVLFWFIAGTTVLIYQWTRGAETTCRPVVRTARFSFAAVPSTVRWPLLLIAVLLFGSFLVRQMIGESHLRAGMSLQSANLYRGIWWFHAGDFKDPTGLAVKLQDAKDPISKYLRRHFSDNTLRLLGGYDGLTVPSESLQAALMDELNLMVRGNSFARTKLNEETLRLIEEHPEEKNLIRINRPFLEEAYPDEIAKNESKLMFGHFDDAMRTWPYQMEIFYILGRYCIDAFQLIELTRSKVEEEVNKTLASTELTPEQQAQIRVYADQEVARLLAPYGLDEVEKMDIIDLGMRALQTDVYLNPIYKWAHNNLGVLYDKRGEFEHSRRSYDRVLDIDNEQIYAHYNHGLGYLRDGQFEKAKRSFEQALVADPNKIDVLQYLGHTFMRMGDAEHAKEALDYYTYKLWDEKGEPWSPNPNLSQTLFNYYSNIGMALAGKGKTEMAVDALVRAASTGYQDAEPRDRRVVSEQLAVNLVRLGRMDDAIVVYQQMLARDDMDNTTRRNLAFLLSNQSRNEEALEAMQRVVHDEPHDWAAWYNCASLKALIGTYGNPSILADLQSAVERNQEEVRKQIVDDTVILDKLKGDPGLKAIVGEDIYLQVEK